MFFSEMDVGLSELRKSQPGALLPGSMLKQRASIDNAIDLVEKHPGQVTRQNDSECAPGFTSLNVGERLTLRSAICASRCSLACSV